jgi:alpha-galactosidase
MGRVTPAPMHLRAAGVSVVLAPADSGAPVVLHWGADLGELDSDGLDAFARARRPGVPHSALDKPRDRTAVPTGVEGFTGAPTVEGLRLPGDDAALAWAPCISGWEWEREDGRLAAAGADPEAELSVLWELKLTPEGVVCVRTTVTNTGHLPWSPTSVRTTVPVPAAASDLLDLTGRWSRERVPQRHPWPQGSWSRAGRHGRTGHDATLLVVAGEPGFAWRRGAVWGVHVAWSGDHVTYAERTPEGECLLGGGELLGPGEVVLAPGEAYESPWLVAVTSTEGLDGLSARLHPLVRRSGARRSRPRPVHVNTWEATYFDHDIDRLTALADASAAVGVERFVLDDGWFRGRRDDRRGLGDWTVDPDVWPRGLHPLVDHVRRRGMEFGLWVEPEMVNEDSDLARAHPGWLLSGRASAPGTWRHQQVLDLQHPEAYVHVRDALQALLAEYEIGYLKWDHNRDLIDVAHAGRPAVHGQTLALYRLLDEVREGHPDLEIESCASGGGRVDLGILTRTDRVWPSDTNDARERQRIQRWTGLLVPPEMIGSHVGGPVSHTTGRRHTLAYRAATALLGHFGIELDVETLTPDERTELAGWVRLHKEVRSLIASGTLVRPDHPDPAIAVTGIVAPDASEAVFVVATTDLIETEAPAPVRLAGLRPDARYDVRDITPAGEQHVADLGDSWLDDREGLTLHGSVLTGAGVQLPTLGPEVARVIRARAAPA